MFRRFANEKLSDLETEPDFRYRGKESSRIEAVSDAVFAFALTLLVVSLNVPDNFTELSESFEDFFAFGLCSLLLFTIWREHYFFFLRYGLRDSKTLYLNSLLLFFILFYIYPLKFLFSFFFQWFKAVFSYIKSSDPTAMQTIFSERILPEQMPDLMAMYGFGAFGVFILFALMYRNAYKKSKRLNLNAIERVYTRNSIVQNLILAAVPLISALLAYFIPHTGLASASSGMAYSLYVFTVWFHFWDKKTKKTVKEQQQKKE